MVFSLFLSVLLFGCTSGDRLAGSKGGSETTNGITAAIHLGTGVPASGSSVRLRSADYVSAIGMLEKATVDSTDITTDAEGKFFIRNIVPGSYSVEVYDTAAGGALLFTCTVGLYDTVDLGTDSLCPYAALTGHIDTTGTAGGQLYVQVRGLERLAAVNSDGSFTLNDLPGGNLDFRIVEGDAATSASELVNVHVVAGDTVTVPVVEGTRTSGYLYLNTLIPDANQSQPVSGFPVLIRFDSSSFDFTQTRPDGADIRFTDARGTPLPFEIEQWDEELQTGAIWVRTDTIGNSTSNQHIIMSWGEADATGRSDGAAVFDTSLGYAGVWHLNEDASAGTDAFRDRTVNGYHGTAAGEMTSGNTVSGIIGKALQFNGTTDHVTAGALNVSERYTLSCWVNAADLDTVHRIIWKEYSYTLWHDAVAGGIRLEHFTDSLVWRGIYQDNYRIHCITEDSWYYLAGTYDGDKIRLYINGELIDSTQSIHYDAYSTNQPLMLGGRKGEYFQGCMDEVRIEKTARSSDWIRLCYRNQMSGGGTVQFKR